MLRFSKISLVVLFCGVAILVAPPAVHAQPRISIRAVHTNPDGTTKVTGQTGIITGNDGVVTFGIINGVLQPVAVGPFKVSLTGTSNSASNGNQGILGLTATVTNGGTKDTLTILLTDTGFTQMGRLTFADNVQGTITGQGSVTFNAFLDSSNTPFRITGNTVTSLSPLGPFQDPRKPPDASYSGSGSTTVTDTSPSSTTSESQVTGGDVSFTLVVKNTPTK